MQQGRALALVFLGALAVVVYYLGAPDSPVWLLIAGSWILMTGIALGLRDWIRHRGRSRRRRR